MILILPPERASGEASAISLDLESPRNLGRDISSRYSNRQPCCFFLFFVFLIFFSFFFLFFSSMRSRSKIVFLGPAVYPHTWCKAGETGSHGMGWQTLLAGAKAASRYPTST